MNLLTFSPCVDVNSDLAGIRLSRTTTLKTKATGGDDNFLVSTFNSWQKLTVEKDGFELKIRYCRGKSQVRKVRGLNSCLRYHFSLLKIQRITMFIFQKPRAKEQQEISDKFYLVSAARITLLCLMWQYHLKWGTRRVLKYHVLTLKYRSVIQKPRNVFSRFQKRENIIPGFR